jgi:serine/threonine protein kinase
MHALYESDTAVYIVTDLASGGELFQQLLSKGFFTEKDASHLVSQILEGVAYLHNHDASKPSAHSSQLLLLLMLIIPLPVDRTSRLETRKRKYITNLFFLTATTHSCLAKKVTLPDI